MGCVFGTPALETSGQLCILDQRYDIKPQVPWSILIHSNHEGYCIFKTLISRLSGQLYI